MRFCLTLHPYLFVGCSFDRQNRLTNRVELYFTTTTTHKKIKGKCMMQVYNIQIQGFKDNQFANLRTNILKSANSRKIYKLQANRQAPDKHIGI